MPMKYKAALFFLGFITGCSPISYFDTGNNLVNKRCTVYLIDGRELQGQLTIQFESGFKPEKFIQLVTADLGRTQISIDSVAYYTYNNDYYFPKEITIQSHTLSNWTYFYDPAQRNLLFLKKLTPPGSRLDLFEFVQKRN